jgi:Rad3-related DNA helicase
MGNYTCPVKEDFIENKTYACGKCGVLDRYTGKKITNTDECRHKVVEYGPCRTGHAGYQHDRKTCELCKNEPGPDYNSVSRIKFHNGCRYRTYPQDYVSTFRNTDNEQIEISDLRREEYQASLKITNKNSSDMWMHTINFDDFEKIRSNFKPCPYYDQLNKGILSSHSIFNYANFLTFLGLNPRFLPQRDLLVLDEGHSIEKQIVEQVGVSISKKILQRYIAEDFLENISYGYDDSIEDRWVVFLENVCRELKDVIPDIISEETRVDAREYLQRIVQVIDDIKSNSVNWIVSKIDRENGKVSKVEFKPLVVSNYCKMLFDKCNRTLIMSATILDVNTFCRSVGLGLKAVKFISVDSDFPIENRPIYPLNTAYLNYTNIQLESVQREISYTVDKLMTVHSKEKGIIHCTSYAQVHFIEKYISRENKRRLILTDPERFNSRDEVIAEHFTSTRPTVLISPSLHTGLDLKNERSRFQIIVKVPYPSLKDRWIDAKRKKDGVWYTWQTAIKLVQAYGRSVRSKEDWAKTYVLDTAFKMFVTKSRLPKWYTDAIKQ